jgi:hypothetical protein
MSFLKDVSPANAIKDFINYVRADRPHNMLMLFLACVPTAIIMITFHNDMLEKSKPLPPEVMYFESWPLDRTRQESIDSITKKQAEADAFLEEKRKGYRTFGRALGLDMEKIERDAMQMRQDAIAAAKKAGKEAEARAAARDKANPPPSGTAQ